ncbi:hypothetical protein RFI_37786 [Reticulomyxa filosa]|uniref:Uncharacterized protein n=1 Tax=Reticulomyxa filosa TaxID=46433 RepID=X6LG25_RETFI|nr:hypothetical protein RFI_37786 [Reticulomyxa filosa]|eukprot:ETN99684.1 hypothetical protein RFI_37786 [Reticulomyxa filosa]
MKNALAVGQFPQRQNGQVVLNGSVPGLLQGSSLFPLMFADDVALWTSTYTSDEKEMELQLQSSLDNVSKWKMLLAQSITFKMKKEEIPKDEIETEWK